MEIKYIVKINVDKYTGQQIEIIVNIEEFDCDSLVDVLLDRNYLKCWCNKNEFEVISREIV